VSIALHGATPLDPAVWEVGGADRKSSEVQKDLHDFKGQIKDGRQGFPPHFSRAHEPLILIPTATTVKISPQDSPKSLDVDACKIMQSICNRSPQPSLLVKTRADDSSKRRSVAAQQ
jgi:hypothetical protein